MKPQYLTREQNMAATRRQYTPLGTADHKVLLDRLYTHRRHPGSAQTYY